MFKRIRIKRQPLVFMRRVTFGSAQAPRRSGALWSSAPLRSPCLALPVALFAATCHSVTTRPAVLQTTVLTACGRYKPTVLPAWTDTDAVCRVAGLKPCAALVAPLTTIRVSDPVMCRPLVGKHVGGGGSNSGARARVQPVKGPLDETSPVKVLGDNKTLSVCLSLNVMRLRSIDIKIKV